MATPAMYTLEKSNISQRETHNFGFSNTYSQTITNKPTIYSITHRL